MVIGTDEIFGVKELGVVKASLGNKLSCQSCGVKFYDFKKTKLVCLTCEIEYVLAKPKVCRVVLESAKLVLLKVDLEAVNSGDAVVEIKDVVIEIDDDAEFENGLMEDILDIGNDDNDVVGVIVSVDGDVVGKV